jgi:rhodanese-related sulfurtransferase
MVETQRGIIPRAKTLPMYLIPHNLNYLFDRQKKLSYCRTGSRSAQVCLFLN